MANDEMLRQPAEPTGAIAEWEQEQRAKRQRAVEGMVFQELQRRGQDGDHVSIAKALLEDPRGEAGSNFAKFMDETEQPLGGWVREDVDALGRNPELRELSPEGRRRDMHLRNRQLLHALWNAPEENRHVHQNLAANAWLNEQGRTHGTSGWAGALANPEYMAGHVVEGNNAIGNAAWFQYSGQNPPSSAQQASEMGAMDRLGGITSRLVGQHIPDAMDLRDARAAASKVDPILPAGMSREEGHAALARLAGATGPNYDEAYRIKHGHYPSYLGSTAAVFFNGLLDPTLFTPGIGAKAATATGVGLMKAGTGGLGKAGIRGAASRAGYGYGKSVARAAAPLAGRGVGGAALDEVIEEAPLNAGIMASFAQYLPKSLREALTPGTDYRRDMHQPVYGQDRKVLLDENRNPVMAKETQEEFLKRMYDNPDLQFTKDPETGVTIAAPNQAHGPNSKMNAAQVRREIPAMIGQIRQTLLRP